MDSMPWRRGASGAAPMGQPAGRQDELALAPYGPLGDSPQDLARQPVGGKRELLCRQQACQLGRHQSTHIGVSMDGWCRPQHGKRLHQQQACPQLSCAVLPAQARLFKQARLLPGRAPDQGSTRGPSRVMLASMALPATLTAVQQGSRGAAARDRGLVHWPETGQRQVRGYRLPLMRFVGYRLRCRIRLPILHAEVGSLPR